VKLSRDDLVMLGAASRETRTLAEMAVEAIFVGAFIDGQIERHTKGYLVVVRLVRAERIVRGLELLVVWSALDEGLKLAVLGLDVRGILLAHDRWRRRMDAAVEKALRDARVRLGLPDEG